MHNTLDDKRELQQLWRLGALESITNIDHSQGSSSLLRCLSSPDDSSSAARTPLIRLMSFHCTFLRLCVVIRVRSHVQVHCTVPDTSFHRTFLFRCASGHLFPSRISKAEHINV